MAATGTDPPVVGDHNRSARLVVPVLLDAFDPSSVVQFGGDPLWLAEFAAHGIRTVGVTDQRRSSSDGWVFECDWHRSGHLDVGRFDLAVCFELAQHLSPARAGWLIDQLCQASGNVAFSAAPPSQPCGNAVNKQWPRYWASRFETAGYQVTGALRFKLWGWAPAGCEAWCPQNLLIASREPNRRNRHLFQSAQADPFAVIHPAFWEAQ